MQVNGRTAQWFDSRWQWPQVVVSANEVETNHSIRLLETMLRACMDERSLGQRHNTITKLLLHIYRTRTRFRKPYIGRVDSGSFEVFTNRLLRKTRVIV